MIFQTHLQVMAVSGVLVTIVAAGMTGEDEVGVEIEEAEAAGMIEVVVDETGIGIGEDVGVMMDRDLPWIRKQRPGRQTRPLRPFRDC